MKIENISFGQYIPKESMIHRLDPRTKFIVTFMIIIAAFSAGFYELGILWAVTIYLIAKSQIGFKGYLQPLRAFVLIISISMVIQIFLIKGDIIIEVARLSITREGVYAALLLGTRLILILMVVSINTLTTTPMIMTDGLERLLKPLKVLKFPIHELVMIMTISLRFIPLFFEEAQHIIKAQMCRGVDYREGSLFNRGYKTISILVPLFNLSFQRANDLAVAMESRAYQGGEGRTHLYELKLRINDYLMLVAVSIVVFIIIYTRGQ